VASKATIASTVAPGTVIALADVMLSHGTSAGVAQLMLATAIAPICAAAGQAEMPPARGA
jgi:hypothetical protein